MHEGEVEGAVRMHVTVRGRVHGVGFRHFTQREACALGLAGYVRNRRDGSVEVVAEGDQLSLDRLLVLLQHGPRSAVVEGVTVHRQPAMGAFGSFSVRF